MTIERSEYLLGFLKIKRKPIDPGTSVTLQNITKHKDGTVDNSTWRKIDVVDHKTVQLIVPQEAYHALSELSAATFKHLRGFKTDSKDLVGEDINSANLVEIPDSPFKRLVNRVTGHSVRYTWTPR